MVRDDTPCLTTAILLMNVRLWFDKLIGINHLEIIYLDDPLSSQVEHTNACIQHVDGGYLIIINTLNVSNNINFFRKTLVWEEDAYVGCESR